MSSRCSSPRCSRSLPASATNWAKHQKVGEYADEIEAAIKERGFAIPMHRLYSIEYHLNDRSFFQACLALVGWLERHQNLFPRLETSAKHADTDKSVRARVNELRQKALYCEQSNFLTMATSDDTYEDNLNGLHQGRTAGPHVGGRPGLASHQVGRRDAPLEAGRRPVHAGEGSR